MMQSFGYKRTGLIIFLRHAAVAFRFIAALLYIIHDGTKEEETPGLRG